MLTFSRTIAQRSVAGAKYFHAAAVQHATTTLTMPALSPTMTEGTITTWKKKEGDAVSTGEVLLEIETDKAGMDVEAVEDGILAKILYPDGSKVAVNEIIALLAEEGDDLSKVEIPKAKAKSETPAKEETPATSAPKQQESQLAQQTASTSSSNLLSPAVAHLLLQNHITDVTKIPSTGPKGRVLKGDVLAYLGKIKPRPAPEPTIPQPKTLPPPSKAAPVSSKASAPTSAPAPAPGSTFTDSPASNMRKVIASRLGESKSTVPHSYVTRDIVIDNMTKLRRLLAEELGVRISVNDFLVKAASLALRDVPATNVQFTSGDSAKQINEIDISVAVATPSGLITPIVKGADGRGVQSISWAIKELADKAKRNKLKPEEYQGGSFSISNLGMFGVNHFTAIINAPQASILAVGGARTVFKPAAVEETDLLSDSDVFDFLGGQNKKSTSPSTTAGSSSSSSSSSSTTTKKIREDLDLIDFLVGNAPLKKSIPSSETALGDEVLRRLHPSLEQSQVVSVTLSIDERVVDSEVAGQFLGRLSHYVENPESMIL